MDAEIRAILRRFQCGDTTLAPRLLAFIDRGQLPQEARVEVMAVLFGERLMDTLRKANEQRRARTVDATRVADRLSRGLIPATVRGGTPPMKRRVTPLPGWPDCLETVLRVEHDPVGVSVRAGVVLYDGRESVEIDIDRFTADKPAAILWATQRAGEKR